MKHLLASILVCLTASAPLTAHNALADTPTRTVHGLSLFGSLKYKPGFDHFDYVNPNAPKGGTLRLSATGSFDSLNPFILKGSPAQGAGLPFDTLMTSAYDEPASEYGLIAERVTVPDDYSWVTFHLRPEARFHDGSAVTAEDVVFSFNILKEKGQPFYRFYYANVTEARVNGPGEVTFIFDETGNRELPQIVGQLPILSKAFWQDRDFTATTLSPVMGSGPYRVAEAVPGRRITYERVADYWAADLNVNRGQNNFAKITYEYYRDDTVALEAFKADAFDVRPENSAKNWATAYDIPATKRGDIKRDVLKTKQAQRMQAFVINSRRPQFADARTRRALGLAFDFNWANKNLFYGQYKRTLSYFEGSELAATGTPKGDELALLEPYRSQLPAELFERPYHLPDTDGSGKIRRELRDAKKLLKEAGWVVRNGDLVHGRTGQQMTIEFLLVQPSFEKVIQPFIRNLERLGIMASIRTVDPSQFQNRVDQFDFDIIVGGWSQSLSPGNEQRDFWGSVAAGRPGSRNYAGINDPVVDALIEKIIFAPNREALVTATRALDRVLLWGHYVIPQWHAEGTRLAYWNRFSHPAESPGYRTGFPTIWWHDAQKAKTVQGR